MSLYFPQGALCEQSFCKQTPDAETEIFSSRDSPSVGGCDKDGKNSAFSQSYVAMDFLKSSERHSQVIFGNDDEQFSKRDCDTMGSFVMAQTGSNHLALRDESDLNFEYDEVASSSLFNLFTSPASYPDTRGHFAGKGMDGKSFCADTSCSDPYLYVESFKSDSDWVGYINDKAGYNLFSSSYRSDRANWSYKEGLKDHLEGLKAPENDGFFRDSSLPCAESNFDDFRDFEYSRKSMSFNDEVAIPNGFNPWCLSSAYPHGGGYVTESAPVSHLGGRAQVRRQARDGAVVAANVKSATGGGFECSDSYYSDACYYPRDEESGVSGGGLQPLSDMSFAHAKEGVGGGKAELTAGSVKDDAHGGGRGGDDGGESGGCARLKGATMAVRYPREYGAVTSSFCDVSGFRRDYRGGEISSNDEWIEQFGDMEMEGVSRANVGELHHGFHSGAQQYAGNMSHNSGSGRMNQNLSRHISRVIMVNNADCMDHGLLRSLFTQYGGPIRDFMQFDSSTLLVGFFDLRHAQKAMNSLNGRCIQSDRVLELQYHFLRDALLIGKENQGTLVIFNLDHSVTNAELQELFGKYGEIKEIRESPNHKHKFIEFYDIRCADKAMKALNKSELKGKKIKIEASRPGGSNKGDKRVGVGGSAPLSVGRSEFRPVSSSYTGGKTTSFMNGGMGQQQQGGGYMTGGDAGGFGSGANDRQGHVTASNRPQYRVNSKGDGTKIVPGAGEVSGGFYIPMDNVGGRTGPSEAMGGGGNAGGDWTKESASLHRDCTRVECRCNIGSNASYKMVNDPNNTIRAIPSTGKHVGNAIDSLTRISSDFGYDQSQCTRGGGEAVLDYDYGNGSDKSIDNCIRGGGEPLSLDGINKSSYEYEYPNSPPFSSSEVVNGLVNNYLSLDEFISNFPPLEVESEEEATEGGDYNGLISLQDSFYDVASSNLLNDLQSLTIDVSEQDVVSGACGSNKTFVAAVSGPSEEEKLAVVGEYTTRKSAVTGGSALSGEACEAVQKQSAEIAISRSSDGGEHEREEAGTSNAVTNYQGHSPLKVFPLLSSVSSEQTDKYDVVIESILSHLDRRTTLMIKNIPNKYDQEMLLLTVNKQHNGQYDFFYLPIDFKNRCNVGYAFINFIDPIKILTFYEEFNNRRWEKFNSEKVCRISYARIQGKQAMIEHFKNSSIMFEDPKCRPLIFCSDGAQMGQPEVFPVGSNIRPRARKDLNDTYSPSKSRIYKSKIKDQK